METSGIVTFIMAEFRNCDAWKIRIRLIITTVITRNYEQLVFPRKKTLQIQKSILALVQGEDGHG